MPDPIAPVVESDSVRAGLLDLWTRLEATQPEGWAECTSMVSRRGEPLYLNLTDSIEKEAGFPDDPAWSPAPLDRSIWTPAVARRFDAFLPWIDRHLAELDAILARPAHGSWTPFDVNAVFAEGLSEGRKFAEALRGRALLARMSGDPTESAMSLQRLRGLGESFLHSGTSLVELLLGRMMVSFALEGMEALLHDGEVPAEVESRWLRHVPSIDQDPALVARALRADYTTLRNSLDALGQDVDTNSWLFKVNRTRASLARQFRACIARCGLSRPERRARSTVYLQESAPWRVVLRANVGELVVPLLLTSLELFLDKVEQLRLSERALRIVLALRVYERTHGVLPSDLETLVSSGILPADASWMDPLSGNPLRYDPARRILWSVGEDGIDDNGAGWEQVPDDREARFRQPDWVWAIPPLPGN